MKKTLFCLLLLIMAGCSKKPPPKELKPIPIKAAIAVAKDVPLYIKTVGLMAAYQTVNVMAQADGLLMNTFFEDGSDVKQGELLYLIDERPYIASLKQAEGALEESIANLQYAQRTAERNSQLALDEYISQNTFDQLVTTVQTDQEVVKQNQAELDTAKINLSYTTIYSPLDARAGKSLIDDGNLILEGAETTLVTLNQITPIYATFFINEKDLLRVKDYQGKGELKTLVTAPGKQPLTYEGKLTIINNEVDALTGMIKLWATLPNEEKVLWPNQYVQIELILDTIENAVLVPFEAVQTNSKGKYVYVVRANQTVEMRSVQVGQMDGDQMIVIASGLKANEVVVTEGHINLYDGAKVRS